MQETYRHSSLRKRWPTFTEETTVSVRVVTYNVAESLPGERQHVCARRVCRAPGGRAHARLPLVIVCGARADDPGNHDLARVLLGPSAPPQSPDSCQGPGTCSSVPQFYGALTPGVDRVLAVHSAYDVR